ncbi:hypothetical protein [Halopenitus persicus]|uniref:ABC-2 type transport system permease protein n=1 Tax=Halopenitus persicus TaxID=1048396 RepID=A0A1H3N961_9EURY|nr:hypothetical protein [Halopenitus persicus]SDY85304.1 hypothetical protein SAMN05216564_1124 [Halopenitus persicus]
MSVRRDIRHGVRIGRAEFVRSVRRQIKNKRRLLGLSFAVLFFGGNLIFVLPTAYILGQTARSITTIPYLAPAATVLPVGILVLALFRTLERIGSSDTEDLLLTTVHPRAVVVGLIAAEVGRVTVWFGLPLGAVFLTFALGLGSPSLLLAVGLLLLPIVCWAAAWGYACGLALLRVFRRLPTIHRVLKVGGVVAMLGLVIASQFVGRYVVEEGVSIRAILELLTFAPLTDYVALAFVGTRLEQPTSVAALGVLGILLATTPIGLAVATRQASTLWFTDRPHSSESPAETTSTGGFQAPRLFAWRKSGRIAWGILLRGVRNPGELGHLVMILFFIGPLGTTVVQSSGDALGPLVAGTGVGIGTYLAGATFGLNPLGDGRPQLPLLLLTTTETRTVVRGRVVAGLAIGIPIAVLGSLASGLLGTSPIYAIVFAVVGVGMCFAAALFAVGIGALYPIYEEREFWGTETVVPSTLVMMGYLFIVGGGTIIGLIVTWYTLTGHISITPILSVSVGVYLLLTIGVSYGSYRYALRQYRGYTID